MLGAGFRASGAGTSGTMDCANWPSTGEIDVMEDVNALSEHSGTLHCGTDPGGPCNETTGLGSGLRSWSGCQTGYNTYSVIINRTNTSNESITWYLNGNAYFTATESQVGTATWQAAVDHGFFLILDLAIGGGYPNGVCGCTSPSSSTSSGAAMSVGYVAVYQTSGSTPTPSPSPTPTGTKQCTTTATADISADCYTGSAGSVSVTPATGDTNPSGVGGNQAAQLRSGNYLEYPGINFGTGAQPPRTVTGTAGRNHQSRGSRGSAPRASTAGRCEAAMRRAASAASAEPARQRSPTAHGNATIDRYRVRGGSGGRGPPSQHGARACGEADRRSASRAEPARRPSPGERDFLDEHGQPGLVEQVRGTQRQVVAHVVEAGPDQVQRHPGQPGPGHPVGRQLDGGGVQFGR
jgi:hypothetical protein